MYLGPKWVFQGVMAFTVVAVASELYGMVCRGLRLQQAWGVLACCASAYLFYLNYDPATRSADTALYLALGLPVITTGSLLFGLARPLPHPEASTRMAWLVAGPLYVGATCPTLAILHKLEHGGAWVTLAMFLAWLGDTGAYAAGRAFGKTKMYPHVSPKKTWEGAVGGLLGSMSGAVATHLWIMPSFPLMDGILLALVASPLGMCGDLFASLIKRATDSKDSGWIVYGHGGMLDRVDALMFTSTATMIYALVWF